MHRTVMDFGRRMVEKYELNDPSYRVLEVGSYNVNGSLRDFFPDVEEYIGVDINEGPGVDIVCSAQNLSFKDKEFDIVLTTEMLEHDAQFWHSLSEINRVLKGEGLLLMSARGATRGKPGVNGQSMFEHSYPHDYWRFMPQSVPYLFELVGCELLESEEDKQHPGFMGLGRKL